MVLKWSYKFFDRKYHFFKRTREKRLIGWTLYHKYRTNFYYSVHYAICLCVRKKHIKQINTVFSVFIKYKYLKVYFSSLFFLHGMYVKPETFEIFNNFIKYSRLTKKRFYKLA